MYRALGFVLVALAAGGCVDLTEPEVLKCGPQCTVDAHVADAVAAADLATTPPDGLPTDGPMDPSDGLGPIGAGCGIAGECQSGFCAQGVCCSTACDAPCYSCALNGSGTCSPVPAGGSSLNRCQDMGAASCGGNGLCDGSGQCSL